MIIPPRPAARASLLVRSYGQEIRSRIGENCGMSLTSASLSRSPSWTRSRVKRGSLRRLTVLPVLLVGAESVGKRARSQESVYRSPSDAVGALDAP